MRALLCLALTVLTSCQPAQEQKINLPAPVPVPEARPAEVPKPEVPKPAAPRPKTPDPTPDWLHAGKEVAAVGDIHLQVVSVKQGTGTFISTGGTTFRAEPHLAIRVRITNASATRIINFSSWLGRRNVFGRVTWPDHGMSLVDSHGNSYKQEAIEPGFTWRARLEDARLRPGDSLEGVLLFEVPLKTAEWVQLDLDAGAFDGLRGRVRFRVPLGEIVRMK